MNTEAGSNKKLWIGLAAAGAALVGGALLYNWITSGDDNIDDEEHKELLADI